MYLLLCSPKFSQMFLTSQLFLFIVCQCRLRNPWEMFWVWVSYMTFTRDCSWRCGISSSTVSGRAASFCLEARMRRLLGEVLCKLNSFGVVWRTGSAYECHGSPTGFFKTHLKTHLTGWIWYSIWWCDPDSQASSLQNLLQPFNMVFWREIACWTPYFCGISSSWDDMILKNSFSLTSASEVFDCSTDGFHIDQNFALAIILYVAFVLCQASQLDTFEFFKYIALDASWCLLVWNECSPWAMSYLGPKKMMVVFARSTFVPEWFSITVGLSEMSEVPQFRTFLGRRLHIGKLRWLWSSARVGHFPSPQWYTAPAGQWRSQIMLGDLA